MGGQEVRGEHSPAHDSNVLGSVGPMVSVATASFAFCSAKAALDNESVQVSLCAKKTSYLETRI